MGLESSDAVGEGDDDRGHERFPTLEQFAFSHHGRCRLESGDEADPAGVSTPRAHAEHDTSVELTGSFLRAKDPGLDLAECSELKGDHAGSYEESVDVDG